MSGLRAGWIAWSFVLALSGAQWLGWVHQTLHAPVGAVAASGALPESHGHAPHGLERLFGHHAGNGTECRLYDAFSHADAACAPVLPALLPVDAAPVAALPATEAPSLQRARPRARGPPPAA